MYLGIYISDSYLSAATVAKNGMVNHIEPQGTESPTKFLVPLRAHCAGSYVYLGNTMECLCSNDDPLEVVSFQPSDLGSDKVLHKDISGTELDTTMLLALFLKNLKSARHIIEHGSITGAIVSFQSGITPLIMEETKKAFALADIQLSGIVDCFRPALMGYAIAVKKKREGILLYNLNPKSVSLDFFTVHRDGYCEKDFQETNWNLGTDQLKQQIVLCLLQTYEAVTKRKIAKTYGNKKGLLQMADKVLYGFFGSSKMTMPLIFAFHDPAIEIKITRKHVNKIYGAFCEEHTRFLKERLKKSRIKNTDVYKIMVAGLPQVPLFILNEVKTFFNHDTTEFFTGNPDQVISKGMALFAESTAEREIATSLLAKNGATQDGQDDKCKGEVQLINRLHINAGYELLKLY